MVHLWGSLICGVSHARKMRIINDILYTENRFTVNLQAAREEGREEGKVKKAKETAMTMLADDEPLEKIIRYTGLTAEQISKLN